MKSKIIFIIFLSLFILCGYWIYNGPRKGITTQVQWSIDEESNELVPIFSIYYEWNGLKESEAKWMIFPKDRKWWVIDIRDIEHVLSRYKNELDFKEEMKRYWNEFTYSWIENSKFEPKITRYEAVMTAFGFKMIFNLEKSAFDDVQKGIKDFKSGKLMVS
jgi:hypothetical protein